MRRVIPVVLIENNRVVKTTCFKKPRYIGDPIVICKLFEEKEADEIMVLDIAASLKSEIDYQVISSIVSECFVPVSYGGGIVNISQVDELIRCGVDKVVINTRNSMDLTLIKEVASKYGSQVIIASIDFKLDFWGRHRVVVGSGRRKMKVPLKKYIDNVVSAGIGELLLTDIDKEGTMSGFNISLLSDLITGIDVPIIITGGAGSKADVHEAFDQLGASAVGCGSLFVYSGARKGILVSYENFAG
jgi:imidazole glycerol-phosphate synthase subunit HisF